MDGGLIVFSLLATFFAAALTVPAGFGLATMITPVVFLWLEPHEAVADAENKTSEYWECPVKTVDVGLDAESQENKGEHDNAMTKLVER